MQKSFGWCFIGCGKITERVMVDLPKTNGGYVAAVTSRVAAHREAFAEKYGAKAYETAEQAISDSNVKAVYVASPHKTHTEYTILALKMGKPVLCEKPFAITTSEAREMIETAKKNNVYLLEGMWTRHNPAIKKAMEWIAEGRIGKIKSVWADFALDNTAESVTSPQFDLNHAGGSIIELGVYPIALSQFVFDAMPERISAIAEFTDTGVDGMCAVNLAYKNGGLSHLFSGITVKTGHEGIIFGEKGLITLPQFWCPDTATLMTDTGSETFNVNKHGEGFFFEFDAAMDDIRAGKKENEFVSHEYTMRVMEILTKVRSQIGLRYPFEKQK